MYTIDLFASSSVIIRTVLSLSPHSPCTFTNTELVDSFSETIYSLRGKLEIHLNKFVHHNESRVISVEIHIISITEVSEGE